MLSRDEQNRIRADIGRINNEIDQIKGEIDQIRDQLNSNWNSLKELREAQRFHQRESRKRHMRHVGYQGGDVDRAIYQTNDNNTALKARKDELFQRKNALHEQKAALYAQLGDSRRPSSGH